MSRPATRTLPSVATSSRSSSLSSVDFPEPEGPTRKTNSPLCDLEVDLTQGDDIALVGLGDVLEANHESPMNGTQLGVRATEPRAHS